MSIANEFALLQVLVSTAQAKNSQVVSFLVHFFLTEK